MRRVSLGRLEVAEGQMVAVKPPAGPALLVARVAGRLHAMDDWCNHAGCTLSEGWLEGDTVVCPCHRMAFRLGTGQLVTIPRLCEDQPVFPVEVGADAEVFVELPAPDPRRGPASS